MTDRYEPVEFEDVEVVRKSDKALLCKVGDHTEWIPMSQIHDDSEVYYNDEEDRGDEGTLIIPRWLAEDKGLV